MPRRGRFWFALSLLWLAAIPAATTRGAAPGAAPDEDDDGPAAGHSGSAAPRRGDGYAIKLTRPMKVGQRYAWSADATVIDSLPGPPGTPTVPETVSVHLAAVVQILAVDAHGEVTEMAATIEECTARTGRERRTIVQPGRVILAEAGKWKTKLTATSGNFTIQDDVLLRSVLSIPRLDPTCDDDVFGTAKRQNVRDTWPIRPDQLARSWAAAGYKLKPQTISGSVKIRSAEVVDGVECLRVVGRAKIEHFMPPALDLPQGVEVGDATTEFKFTKLLPADPSLHALQDSHSMTVRVVLKKDPRSITPEVREGKLLRSVGVKMRLLPD